MDNTFSCQNCNGNILPLLNNLIWKWICINCQMRYIRYCQDTYTAIQAVLSETCGIETILNVWKEWSIGKDAEQTSLKIASSWNMETINCFQNLRNPASKEILSNCFFDSQKLAVYSKEAVCERLEVAKECLKTEIKRICIDDITIKNFRDELLKIFSKPCQKEE